MRSGSAPSSGTDGARRGGDQAVEEDRRLADAHRAGHLGLDDEESAVEAVAPPVLDRGGEGVEPGGFLALEVEEDRTAPQMVGHAVDDVLAHHLEQRMTRRHPFQGRVRGQERLVEGDLGVVAPQPAEPRLQPLADRDQGPGHLADAVDVHRPWPPALGWTPEIGAAWTKKSSITSGTSRRSRASTDLPMIAERLSSFLASPSRVDSVIARNRWGFDVADDPGLDVGDVGPAGVEVAEQPLQQVAGEDLADHVEDLVRAQLLADLAEPFQELGEHPPFVGVHRHEVEDEAVVLLAVAVDAAHPLLQPHRVPGDVHVHEHVAELEVDPLAGRLGRHQDLGLLLELALGVDAGARRVAVADLHPAVDLGDRQPPLAELAERPAVLAVAREVIERVLVLGEEQQLRLGVGERPRSRSGRGAARRAWCRRPWPPGRVPGRSGPTAGRCPRGARPGRPR